MKEYDLSGLRIRYTRLHKGNSSKKQRMNSPYLVEALLYDKTTHLFLGSGISRCSGSKDHGDVPNKRIGKQLALVRALDNMNERKGLVVSRVDRDLSDINPFSRKSATA